MHPKHLCMVELLEKMHNNSKSEVNDCVNNLSKSQMGSCSFPRGGLLGAKVWRQWRWGCWYHITWEGQLNFPTLIRMNISLYSLLTSIGPKLARIWRKIHSSDHVRSGLGWIQPPVPWLWTLTNQPVNKDLEMCLCPI